jgi:hypothetical protein
VLVLSTQVIEYDVCDVTLSVYPHRASLNNMPGWHDARGRACFVNVDIFIFSVAVPSALRI